jgi:hypothetical protein
MADDNNEYAAASLDDPKLAVKEGEDIDYTIILWFYLAADLRKYKPFSLLLSGLSSRIDWPPTSHACIRKNALLCLVYPKSLCVL